MRPSPWFAILITSLASTLVPAFAEIGIISPADAKRLIETPDVAARPIVLDTRGGYKESVWLKSQSLPAELTESKAR